MAATFQPSSMPGYQLPVYEYRTPPELARGAAAGSYPVAVVGAGLVGLTAALELGVRGVRTVILDDDNTVGAAGLSSRGICYAKRSLEILERFGVAERIRAKGATWNEGEVYRGAQRLYRFNLQPDADQKFPAFVNLQQFYVEQYLVEALGALPQVDLRWRNKVVGIERGEDGVTLAVETPQGAYRLRSAYVIAADGGGGPLRRLIGAEDEAHDRYESLWCIADVRLDTREAPVRKMYLDGIPTQGGTILFHQMGDGVWRTDWLIGHLPDPEAEAAPERAVERLKKLLDPATRFELIWVGPYRFKKRLLKRMVHGRVLFAGDAAHEQSPFGARGGNSGVQDANNLAWKLALVLQGKAHADLLETYHEERHFAALDNTENATRSAIFIGPETAGQRLIRDAILDLAQRHAWARPLVNVGRLSVATTYADSTLNPPLDLERDAFDGALACPGAAAPDGRFGDGYFIDQLGGEFAVAYFGAAGPSLGVKTIAVGRAGPGRHVRFPPGRARPRALRRHRRRLRARRARQRPQLQDPTMTQIEIDRLYDALAELVDTTPKEQRERVLARLAVTLAQRLDDYQAALEAISIAKQK